MKEPRNIPIVKFIDRNKKTGEWGKIFHAFRDLKYDKDCIVYGLMESNKHEFFFERLTEKEYNCVLNALYDFNNKKFILPNIDVKAQIKMRRSFRYKFRQILDKKLKFFKKKEMAIHCENRKEFYELGKKIKQIKFKNLDLKQWKKSYIKNVCVIYLEFFNKYMIADNIHCLGNNLKMLEHSELTDKQIYKFFKVKL